MPIDQSASQPCQVPQEQANAIGDGIEIGRIYALAAALAVLLMCVRIVSTYSTFTQTWDEPFHIACGMEWLDKHVYNLEAEHPPLSRIAAALGPWLAGARSHGFVDPAEEGNTILATGGHYTRNLALARLGELPFVVLACAGVWAWTRHCLGSRTAFIAVLLFSMLPPILAHGGFATTDMAVTATCTWAFYSFGRFLQYQTLRSAIGLGFWTGLALLSKYTALLFLTFGFPVICFAWGMWSRKRAPLNAVFLKRMGRLLATAIALSALLVWAGYRFTFAPLFEANDLQKRHAIFPAVMNRPGVIHTVITKVPVPAGQFFRGIGQVVRHNDAGQEAFLLGQIRVTGWWYFFPVVLALKTPLGLLLLVLWGAVLSFIYRCRDWRIPIPALAALLILLLCLPSRINIGVRHILPMYPLMSITAAFPVAIALKRGRLLGIGVAAGLVAWLCCASILAHPDYVAYFNELTGSHPERARVDSDLDWGQDLGRLSATLQQLHAHSLTLAYFGTADVTHFGLPPLTGLSCDSPMSGYVAASLTNLYVKRLALLNPEPVGMKCTERLEELQRTHPLRTVGKSILLYYFPPRQPGSVVPGE